jgi:hypothetical protein
MCPSLPDFHPSFLCHYTGSVDLCSSRDAIERPLRKEVLQTVQYATMVDLLREAEIAGEARTEFVNERLADAFDIWLSEQDLGEITEEEEDALRRAFEKGFGICVHNQE